ncbi:MAG: cellulose-binding domain-containing protein, partial [Oscillospiraceae bacterium]|nr:cellulose-binding domain-containing protein [Oscillospiraceae bacterium]
MMEIRKILFSIVDGIVSASMLLTSISPGISALAEDTEYYSYLYDDYQVSYEIKNSWGNTENISVTITNIGEETIENWMLAYDDYSGNITDIWDAVVVDTDSGDSYIRNAGYNANILPNSSITFGYNLYDSESVPEQIIMCQKRVKKSDNDFDVSLNVTSDWGSGFNAEILLKNNMDKPLEWWELEFDTNFTITEITTSWAADKFDLGDTRYMFKGTYEGIIPPQSTVCLGFSGIKNETLDDPMISASDLTEVVFGGFPGSLDTETARQSEIDYVNSLNEDKEYPAEFG